MSDLVAMSFRGEDTADQVLNKLVTMRKEHLIDLEDACMERDVCRSYLDKMPGISQR